MRGLHPRSRVTHDRWLVSYADFITLLLGLFVVLYAFACADEKKKAQLPAAIDSAFKALGVYPQYSLPAKRTPNGDAISGPVIVTGDRPLASAVVKDDLNRIRRDLEQRLSGQIAQHTVVLRMGRDGLVISLSEAGFFDSGSATPRPEAIATLHEIATTFAQMPYDMRVEGHTDNVPIHTAQFDSNWELSSARANRIGRVLLAIGAVPPDRLSTAGYSEFRPVDTNETPVGRANNRRVDLVILPRSAVDFAAQTGPGSRGPWRRITDGD